jgi:hypothetical protein
MRRITIAALVGALAISAQLGMGREVEAADVLGHTLPPHSTHTYTQYFRAGQLVTVLVSGDGDTDLDLTVWAPSGWVVARDDDDSDDCVAMFVAPETGYYRIVVVNHGDVPNVYRILIQ